VPILARVGASAAWTGALLVFGSSVAGALLNPGVAEIVAAAAMTKIPAPALVVLLVPVCLAAFLAGLATILVARRLGLGRTDPPLQGAVEPPPAEGAEPKAPPPTAYAIFPPLPLALLLAAHPSLPTHDFLEQVIPDGLEVFTAMLGGTALTIAIASRDRGRSLRVFFEGMGFAFGAIITIIAVSAGAAKALEVAGVLGAFVDLTSGNPIATYFLAAALAFGLAFVSGSGTAASVALITALGPHTDALGIPALALAGVILAGGEAGRTASPVAAVLLFGGTLTATPPRTLVQRLILPCLLATAAGTVVCLLRFR